MIICEVCKMAKSAVMSSVSAQPITELIMCDDCGGRGEYDPDPPDAINPYARPYDDALAGRPTQCRLAPAGSTSPALALMVPLVLTPLWLLHDSGPTSEHCGAWQVGYAGFPERRHRAGHARGLEIPNLHEKGDEMTTPTNESNQTPGGCPKCPCPAWRHSQSAKVSPLDQCLHAYSIASPVRRFTRDAQAGYCYIQRKPMIETFRYEDAASESY